MTIDATQTLHPHQFPTFFLRMRGHYRRWTARNCCGIGARQQPREILELFRAETRHTAGNIGTNPQLIVEKDAVQGGGQQLGPHAGKQWGKTAILAKVDGDRRFEKRIPIRRHPTDAIALMAGIAIHRRHFMNHSLSGV